MKTIQEQYNQIKKGKGNKEIFLKEVKRNYPNMVVNSATFTQAEKILLNRSVLSENISGAVIQPKAQPNWFKIFDESMEIIKEANPKNPNRFPPVHIAQTKQSKADEDVKADSSKVAKQVEDIESHNFDNTPNKDNYDTLNGEEFRLGVKFEMDKVRETVSDADLGEAIDKAQKLVAKNLAGDALYYIKNAMFGVDKLGYTDEAPGLTASKSDQMEKVKLKENKMISLMDLMENGPLGEKIAPKKPKAKKETLDTKLAEIDKQSNVVALEAKIAHIDEIIESKNQRISMVTEDENLSELVDKTKMKAMQREVKDLERRKMKMEKIYEKTCGKAYKKMVDEQDGPGFKKANGMGADWVPKTVGQSSEKYRENVMEEEDLEEESNANSNDGSNDNSNYSSNENPESYSGLKKFRKN
tara:strand:+ start:200 stop:1441 length:1242 start_codon:yes stop_codon:yes gene_type:complete